MIWKLLSSWKRRRAVWWNLPSNSSSLLMVVAEFSKTFLHIYQAECNMTCERQMSALNIAENCVVCYYFLLPVRIQPQRTLTMKFHICHNSKIWNSYHSVSPIYKLLLLLKVNCRPKKDKLLLVTVQLMRMHSAEKERCSEFT